jgi:sugar/nucleoside kinase (ribokinase family)
MERDIDVMVAGTLCFDVIPRIPRTGARTIGDILRPGKLVHVEQAAMSTGGPVSNTGIALQKLGKSVCFCARVADDEFGRLTQERLRGRGEIGGIRVIPGAVSSYTVAIAPPGIDRIFLHCPGANDDLCGDDIQPELIRRCRHFHLGCPPQMRRLYENDGAELARVFRIAREAGATTSCDMSLPDPSTPAGKAPWSRILEAVLPSVDIYLPSAEETLYMLEKDRFLAMKQEHADADLIDFLAVEDYVRLTDKLLSMGPKMVGIKSGHRGYFFRSGPVAAFDAMGAARPGNPANWACRQLWCPAFLCDEIASATGSGDSSIAGFLKAFLDGLPVEKTLKVANCLGWQNLGALDAVSSIRDWAGTRELLASDMTRIDIPVAGPGWSWDAAIAMWVGPSDSGGTGLGR